MAGREIVFPLLRRAAYVPESIYAYICQDTLQWLPSLISVWRYRFVIRAQSGKLQNTYNLRRFLLMPLSGGLKP